MSETIEEVGPIDYIVIQYPPSGPTGQALPHLIDLVDRGLIRILDFALLRREDADTYSSVDLTQLGEDSELSAFDGASSGLLNDDDLSEVAAVLDDGHFAAVLVYENTWAGPFAAAVREAGGELIANGRIPVQAILAALENE